MAIEICLPIGALIVAIVAAVGAIVAAYVAWRAVKEAKKMARYTYLANKWYDIKERELDNPDFTNLSKTSSYKTSFTGDSLRKYEIFAWMCWGHAEDIFLNEWSEDPGFKPSLKRYKELHRTWLKDPENSKHFNPEFTEYIDNLQ